MPLSEPRSANIITFSGSLATSTIAMALPDTAIRAIVSELQDDVPALQACSQLSKAWLLPANELLFAEVCVSSDERCQEFLNLLDEKSLSFAKHVKKLILALGDDEQWVRLGKADMVLIAASMPRLSSLVLWAVCWVRPGTAKLRAKEQQVVATVAAHHGYTHRKTLQSLLVHALYGLVTQEGCFELDVDPDYAMNVNPRDIVELLSPFERIVDLKIAHEPSPWANKDDSAPLVFPDPKAVALDPPPEIGSLWLSPAQSSANILSLFRDVSGLHKVRKFSILYSARDLRSLRVLKKILLVPGHLAIHVLGLRLELPSDIGPVPKRA